MVVFETDDSSTNSTVTVPGAASSPPSCPNSTSAHCKRNDIRTKIKRHVAPKKIDVKNKKRKTLSVRFDLQQNKFFEIRKLKDITEREKKRRWYQRSEMQRIKLDVKDHVRILRVQPQLIDMNYKIDEERSTSTNDSPAPSGSACNRHRFAGNEPLSSNSIICVRGLEADVFSDTIGKQRETVRVLSKLVVFVLQRQQQQQQQQVQGDMTSETNSPCAILSHTNYSIAEEYQRITAASQEIAIRMGLLDQVFR